MGDIKKVVGWVCALLVMGFIIYCAVIQFRLIVDTNNRIRMMEINVNYMFDNEWDNENAEIDRVLKKHGINVPD